MQICPIPAIPAEGNNSHITVHRSGQIVGYARLWKKWNKRSIASFVTYYNVFKVFQHTHIDDRTVAGQTGAVAILCSHHNSVFFSTV